LLLLIWFPIIPASDATNSAQKDHKNQCENDVSPRGFHRRLILPLAFDVAFEARV
jgi:hypothetical protein